MQPVEVAAAPVTVIAQRPPRPWWAVLLAVGSVVLATVLVAICAVTVVSTLSIRTTQGSVREAGVSAVRIVGPNGQVRVNGDPAVTDVTAQWSLRASSGTARVTQEVRDGVLEITSACPDEGPFARSCELDLDVTVPTGTALSAEVATGTVIVEALSGDVDVAVSTGYIELGDLTSQLVSASNNVGAVFVTMTAPPQLVTAATNVGAVEVVVPDDGTTYTATASTNVGEARETVPGDRAERVITASTNVGAARIRTASQPTFGDE